MASIVLEPVNPQEPPEVEEPVQEPAEPEIQEETAPEPFLLALRAPLALALAPLLPGVPGDLLAREQWRPFLFPRIYVFGNGAKMMVVIMAPP